MYEPEVPGILREGDSLSTARDMEVISAQTGFRECHCCPAHFFPRATLVNDDELDLQV